VCRFAFGAQGLFRSLFRNGLLASCAGGMEIRRSILKRGQAQIPNDGTMSVAYVLAPGPFFPLRKRIVAAASRQVSEP
jgi:hypothetical protein